jgi:Zn-dependent protease
VFLLEPQRTEFDLSWRMFGVRVRVHPMFWAVAAILGWDFLNLGFGVLLLFIGCVFISILVHELGHVFMGRFFGRESHIVLYSFGGLAISDRELPSRWQRIAVMFAGPLAGFLLFGLVFLFEWRGLPALDPNGEMPMLSLAVGILYWMNLVWSILNLLPIWPLDGGQISRELFTWLAPRSGLRLSLGISLVLAGLLAIQALTAEYGRPLIPFLDVIRGKFNALVFGLLALQNFLLLQEVERRPWREDWPSGQYRDRNDW